MKNETKFLPQAQEILDLYRKLETRIKSNNKANRDMPRWVEGQLKETSAGLLQLLELAEFLDLPELPTRGKQ